MAGDTHRFAGGTRIARGLVLGAAVLTLTALAHSVGGPGSPSVGPSAMLWLLPLTGVLSVLLADRRRSTIQLLSFLLGVQVLLHVMLVVSTDHSAHGSQMVPSATMVVAHVLAAVAAAAVLQHGDAVLHGWMRFLQSLSCGTLPHIALLPDAASVLGALPWPTSRSRQRRFSAAPLRRGPPVVAAA